MAARLLTYCLYVQSWLIMKSVGRREEMNELGVGSGVGGGVWSRLWQWWRVSFQAELKAHFMIWWTASVSALIKTLLDVRPDARGSEMGKKEKMWETSLLFSALPLKRKVKGNSAAALFLAKTVSSHIIYPKRYSLMSINDARCMYR